MDLNNSRMMGPGRWSGGAEEKVKGQGQRSRDKVNHQHHHVLHVSHLGQFLHVPRVGHLAQIYCFLSIIYNLTNATAREEGRRL